MGRGVKFAMAFAVLLVGLTVAMLYRRPAPPPKAAKPADLQQPVIRSWADPPPPQTPTEVTQATPLRHPRAMIRASIEKNEPPPRLALAYPGGGDSSSSLWAEVPDDRLLQRDHGRPALRIHTVAEGDTLALLAERYLGAADRAVEIFELNRRVLSSPDALPIGVELRIPPRPAPKVEEDRTPRQPAAEEPLVPIHRQR